MYLKPCRSCPLSDNCEKRKELGKALHKLGVTSAKYKCEEWQKLFPIGSTVQMTLRFEYCNNDGYFYDEIEAIVTHIQNGKFWTWPLDKGEVENIFITRNADNMTLIEAPLREVCPECHKPKGEKRGEWFCDTCGIACGMDFVQKVGYVSKS